MRLLLFFMKMYVGRKIRFGTIFIYCRKYSDSRVGNVSDSYDVKQNGMLTILIVSQLSDNDFLLVHNINAFGQTACLCAYLASVDGVNHLAVRGIVRYVSDG